MKLIWKILIGLGSLILALVVSAWIYFSSEDESYPDGLSQGAVAPHFSGKDQYGNTVSLRELTTKGEVVLIFFRGTWCPMCSQHIAALQDSLNLIRERGASVVTITPEKPAFRGENNFKSSIDIPVIYDEDLAIMDQYEVAYAMSLGTQRIFDFAGVDFDQLYGIQRKMPIPATYIVGKDGKIRYAKAGKGGLKIEYATVRELLAVL